MIRLRSTLVRRMLPAALVALYVLAHGLAWPASGSAQGSRERAAAARAFDRGTQEALTENWESAAQWFETADRLSPAAAALSHAIESRRRAGHALRAASLALRLQQSYPDDEAAQAMAAEVLDGAAARYVRVNVSCDASCTVEVDGSLTNGMLFFVEPGQDHEVAAAFVHGRLVETIRGQAGQTRALSFEAPRARRGPAARADSGADGQPLALSEPFRFSKATFVVASALTLGGAAALVWSGIDTNRGVGAYEDQGSLCMGGDAVACDTGRRLLRAGQSRERRTNALIGVTAGLAATTLLVAILTDWSGGGDDDSASERSRTVTPAVSLGRRGGLFALEGRF